MRSFAACVLPGLCLVACATAQPAIEKGAADDPCRVVELELDGQTDPRCLVPYDRKARPAPDALSLRLAGSPARIGSGETRELVLELRNDTSGEVSVPLPEGCLVWNASATSTSGVTTFESECGGLCGTPPQMRRFVLAPGGVLRKRVPLAATRVRIAGETCAEEQLGPLPPGAYTLEVMLPWLEPAPRPEDPNAQQRRTFEAELTVTP